MESFPEQALVVARAYFEPQLRLINLGQSQIEGQTLEELEGSLATVSEAIDRAPSFGYMPFEVSAQGGVILSRVSTVSALQVGILPILLERKSFHSSPYCEPA